MNFGFTEEQDLLRAELRKFLDQNAPLERVCEIVETESGVDPNLSSRMAELGWVGLNMPEEQGGVGLDLETLIVILGSSATVMGGDQPAVDGGDWARYSVNWPEVVIGGGTPNIQKNIIAERILGLPKD